VSQVLTEIVYWRFDEGKGAQVNDMTDNELHSAKFEGGLEWEPLDDG
jgi:hypothetical protein